MSQGRSTLLPSPRPNLSAADGGFCIPNRNGCCVPKTPVLHLLIVLRCSFNKEEEDCKVLPAVSVVMVGEAMEATITWQCWTD